MRNLFKIFPFFVFLAILPSIGSAQSTTKSDEISELKDRVLDRKLQLNLVRELIRREKLDTQYPVLDFVFKNSMSNRYILQSVEYFVDEEKVFSFLSDADSADSQSKEVPSFNLNLAPGSHQVRVVAIYKGNDSGVFSYLNNYKVRSEGTAEVEIKKGQNSKLDVVGFEKGGLFTDFKERPSVEITVSK